MKSIALVGSIACLFIVVCVGPSRPSARQGKKVYISVDMEGISGVSGDDQTAAGQPEYARARKLMAEDANAAIRGAFDGGAPHPCGAEPAVDAPEGVGGKTR